MIIDTVDGVQIALHAIHIVDSKGIELPIGHFLEAIQTRKLVLFLLKGSFDTINAGTIVFRNQSGVFDPVKRL